MRILPLMLSLVLLSGLSGVGLAGDVVDLNTADAATLAAAMTGIGPAKAAAIVRYREANGPFTRLEQLAQVKGIGPATVEHNRDRVAVGAGDGP